MGRALLWALVGVALIEWLALIWTGQFDRPPVMAVLVLLLVLLLGIGDVLKRKFTDWREERKPSYFIPGDPAATDLGRRLMGVYPAFVVEAAAEINESSPRVILPVLERAVERLINERPPGWREMTRALVSALGRIGDPHCLPLLRRVERTPGAHEIAELAPIVRAMEDTALLLRSSPARAEDGLLRSSRNEGSADTSLLLRSGLD